MDRPAESLLPGLERMTSADLLTHPRCEVLPFGADPLIADTEQWRRRRLAVAAPML
jgi:hypothetical protein